MTPLEAAARPLAMLDGMPAGMALEAWIHKLPPNVPLRGPALVRLAALLRPIDPVRTFDILDTAAAAGVDPRSSAAIRCAALLETNPPTLAAPRLPQVPLGPVRDLLEARLALLTGRGPRCRIG